MSFHESATNIELEDDHILKATLRNEDGDEEESTLNLNDIIGNNNGMCPCRLGIPSCSVRHFSNS
jgi:hypothetical protein